MDKCKIISMLLAVVFLATAGCSGSSVSEIVTAKNTKRPESLKIANYFCGFYNEQAKEGEESQKDIWVRSMSDQYGVDISLYAKMKDDVNIAMQYLDPIKQGLPFDGLWCYPEEKILELARAGMILPIDEYLKDNKTWRCLPQAMRDSFKYEGHVYALPIGFSVDPQVRILRKDWLNKLNLTVPTDVYEFKEVLRTFKVSNSLAGDKTVIPLVCDNATTDLEDIWNAFGMTMKNGAIRWDDGQNCFIDQLLLPEAEQALTYLKSLYAEGLMSPIYQNGADVQPGVIYDNDTARTEGYASSFLGRIEECYTSDLASYTLQNTESRNLDYSLESDVALLKSFYTTLNPITAGTQIPVQYTTGTYAGYVLGKDTPQPKESINFMVDLLFSSKQSFLECYLGINDLWSIDSAGKVTMKLKSHELMQGYTMAGLCTYVMGLYDETLMGYAATGDADKVAQMSLSNEMYKQKNTTINKLLDGGQLKFLTMVKDMPTSEKDNFSSTALNTLLYKVLTDPGYSAQQGLKEYRQTCKENGMQDYIEDINHNAGVRSSQQY